MSSISCQVGASASVQKFLHFGGNLLLSGPREKGPTYFLAGLQAEKMLATPDEAHAAGLWGPALGLLLPGRRGKLIITHSWLLGVSSDICS